MGTTAQKLQYLATTKTKIKDVANMTGAGIDNNTTFRNYAQALYDGYINVLQDRDTLLDNMNIGTSTGTISDSANLPVYEYKASKLSTQDGTPTPSSPVEVKTVKGYRNLFDKDNANIYYGYVSPSTSKIIVGGSNDKTLYITIKPNTKYTITKILASPFTLCTSANIENQTSVTNAINRNNFTNYTITSGSSDTYLCITYYKDTTTKTEQEILNSLMIVEGDQVLPYVPYGTNWIYTKVIGKNEFDGEIELGSLSATGAPTSTNNSVRTKNFQRVKPNTAYKISNDKGYQANVKFYDINKNYLSNASGNTGTFTTTNDTYFVKWRSSELNVENDVTVKYQLEQGTQATSYEPYKENIVTIPLNNNEICGIGDYKDELIVDKYGHCWLNKKIGKSVLNGSESGWSASTIVKGTTAIGYRYQIIKLFAGVAVNNDGSVKTPSLCDYFVPISNQPWLDEDYTDIQDCIDKYGNSFVIYKQNSSSNRIVIFHNDYATTSNLTEFKNWLNSHNTTIYYALETPTLIDLNYNVDLTLYEGTNNITNSEDMDMSIKYIKDTYE